MRDVIKSYYGENEHQFDELRLPNTEGLHPVLPLIHAGFQKGTFDLSLMDEMAIELVKEGYAIWNKEYRHIDHPQGGWPGTFHDVSSAPTHFQVLAN